MNLGKALFTEGKEVKEIELKNLFPSPLNTFSPDDLEELAENISIYGLITPLSVIGPDKKGKYEILSGERRYRALISLYGNDDFKVPCYIIDNEMDDYNKTLVIETSNIEVRNFDKNLHQMKIVQTVFDMNNDENYKHKDFVKDVMKYLNVSDRYARMYAKVFENPDVRQKVEEHKITVQEGGRIAGKTKEEQSEIFERLDKGEKASKIIDEMAEKKKEKPNIDKIIEKHTEGGAEAFNKLMQSTDLFEEDEKDNSFLVKDSDSTDDKKKESPKKSVAFDDFDPYEEEERVAIAEKVVKWAEKMERLSVDDLLPEEDRALNALTEMLENLGRI